MLTISRSGLEVEVTVPRVDHKIFEWFVSVRDAAGQELWSDWMEHIGREPVEVERELREFLTAFLTGISASNVRLSSSPSGLLKRKVKRELQIWIDGEWAPWHRVFPDDDE
jgi:hypothetical protein